MLPQSVVRCLRMHGATGGAGGLDGDESDASSVASGDEEDETRQMHDGFTSAIHPRSALPDELTKGETVAVYFAPPHGAWYRGSVVRTHSTDAHVRFADAARAVATTSASCSHVCVCS